MDKCAICQDELDKSSVYVSCYHLFHYKCIIKWWRTSYNGLCPLCRSPIWFIYPIKGGSLIYNYNFDDATILKKMHKR